MSQTQTTQNVHVKAKFGEDQRRFLLEHVTYDYLLQQLKKFFSLNPSSKYAVLYQDDDGDWITFSTDAELSYALNLSNGQLLKVEVREAPSPAPTPSAPLLSTPLAPPPQLPVPPSSSSTTPVGLYPPARLYPAVPENRGPVPSYGYSRSPSFGYRDGKEAKREFKKEFKELKRAYKEEKKGLKLKARFVKHVTVEDGTEMEPFTPFTKTWRFRNEGPGSWPAECSLLYISKKNGDQMSGPDRVLLPSAVSPGTEIDVPVQLVAPGKPGRYVGYWRLVDPTGIKFGQRVRILIQVGHSPSNSSEETDAPIPFSALLNQLTQMGFDDKGKNVKLLLKHKGDVDKVVMALVRKQKKFQKELIQNETK